jgi:hypothetical protein
MLTYAVEPPRDDVQLGRLDEVAAVRDTEITSLDDSGVGWELPPLQPTWPTPAMATRTATDKNKR